jgi:hypothetical protein
MDLQLHHEHDPIVVIDDLRLDEHGQPAAWLYHVECYHCGQVLDLDPADP